MKKYTQHVQTTATPQSQPILDTAQVPNSAGGYAWPVDDWERLLRFLILGSEGGTYYVSEHKLTRENAEAVLRCLKTDGARTVETIAAVSEAGRAPKNDPAVFALALCAGLGDPATRALALAVLPRVCRIGTHLFHFAEAIQGFRGWGRGLRSAVARWYKQPADRLAMQVLKYVQRDGWSHRDLLCLAHPTPPTPAHAALYDWVLRGLNDEQYAAGTPAAEELRLVRGMEILRRAEGPADAAALVREYRLPREAVENVNTAWLQDRDLWAALLEEMPMEAMTRNLGVMTARGLLKPMATAISDVVTRLRDQERIRKARLHPIKVLAALITYQGGQSKGGVTWTPVQQIVDALDAAFYLAFGNVETTGKRFLYGLDVSGSMRSGSIAGVAGLTPAHGTAAMSLVLANREPNHLIMAFADGIRPLHISPRERLDDVIHEVSGINAGGTDCSLPMLHAMKEKLDIDGFVVLTDSETWAGHIHPVQALLQYRRQTGIPAKLVVVGMTSNGFTIADPNDAGMLDVVGFDTATPQLIGDFVAR